MAKQKFPLEKVYTLLGSGPVLLISSAIDGRPNVMTVAWHMPIDFDPLIVGCCIGDQSYTHEIVRQTNEFAINIPTSNMIKKIFGCGSTPGKTVDKFKKFKLTTFAASKIDAPLIKECYANLECRVTDASLIDRYNIFIAEVVAAWVDADRKTPPKTLHHVSGKKFVLGSKIVTA